jgi:hypothetical protein
MPHRTSYQMPGSPTQEPPGTRRIFARDPCFQDRPRLCASVDDDRHLVWFHRHQDKRYLSVPIRDILTPEMQVVFDHVAQMAAAEGKLACDVWRELAAGIRNHQAHQIDQNARMIATMVRNQAERWGLQVGDYLDGLEQLTDWNSLVKDVADEGITAAERIRRTLARREAVAV